MVRLFHDSQIDPQPQRHARLPAPTFDSDSKNINSGDGHGGASTSVRLQTPHLAPVLPGPSIITPSHIHEPLQSYTQFAGTSEKVILVMGVTGAGKSRFIQTITGDSKVTVGDRLRSCTQVMASYGAALDGQQYRFLDTPGFNDTDRSENDILLSLVTWLCDLYRAKVTISGILYFHRISDDRMQGSTLRNLRAFEALCGDASMSNVILVTTHWDQVSFSVGEERESELREGFWMRMIQHGARTGRFNGTVERAKQIVGSLKGKGDTVLAIQREIVINNKELSETDVGRIVNEKLEKSKERLEKELHQVQEGLRIAQKMGQDMQTQMSLQAEKIMKELEEVSVKREWQLVAHQRELSRWEERYSSVSQQLEARQNKIGIWEFLTKVTIAALNSPVGEWLLISGVEYLQGGAEYLQGDVRGTFQQ